MDFGTCAAEARHMVHESDANFRMISDQQSRPWKLAIVPLAMDSTDWSRLEAGLQQRVRLLEAILADMLGPQKLLKAASAPGGIARAQIPSFREATTSCPSQDIVSV